MLNFLLFTKYNIKNYEVSFSGLIVVTACYVYSFNSTNIALQLLNLVYSLNKKKNVLRFEPALLLFGVIMFNAFFSLQLRIITVTSSFMSRNSHYCHIHTDNYCTIINMQIE